MSNIVVVSSGSSGSNTTANSAVLFTKMAMNTTF